MDKLHRKTSQMVRKCRTTYDAHEEVINRAILIGSGILLLAIVIVLSIKFTLAHLSTGDQYDNSYMTLGWHPGAHLTFLTQHTNLMKLPFLWAQATFLPYNKTSLIAMNVLLTGGAVFGWSFVIHKIYKRPLMTASVNLLLAGVLLAAPDFSGNLIESSIRNIEYPIAFAYLYIVWRVLKDFSWKKWVLAGSVLSILVASDLFFLYTIPVACVVVLSLQWIRKHITTKVFWIGVASSASGAVGGLIILKILSLLGVLNLVSVSRYFLPYDLLWGQVQNAIHQAFVVFGADFFGLYIKPQGIARALLGAILIASCFTAYKAMRQNTTEPQSSSFISMTLGVLFAITILVYILSGFATSGQGNIRYITSLPFIAVFFVAYGLRKHEFLLLGVALVVVCAGIVCTPALKRRIAYDKWLSDTWITLDYKIVDSLNKNHVNLAYGTLGYSSTTWFNSNRTITVGNIRPCNIKNPLLATSVWYENKQPTKPSALIVDRLPAPEWEWETWANCSDQKIEQIYGKPTKRELIGYQQGKPLEVWYFNYDISSRMVDRVNQ